MLNGAGNKLRANTTVYMTTYKESGIKKKRPLLQNRQGKGGVCIETRDRDRNGGAKNKRIYLEG